MCYIPDPIPFPLAYKCILSSTNFHKCFTHRLSDDNILYLKVEIRIGFINYLLLDDNILYLKVEIRISKHLNFYEMTVIYT